MKRAALILAGAIVLASPAVAQVENESGWSQGDGYSSNMHGETRSGTSWQTQSDGAGTTFYSDTNGKHCWSQPSATGGQFTSCR